MRTRTQALFVVALLWACREPDTTRPSLIDAPRVLAVRAEPAEAAPGESVLLDVLVADGGGVLPEDMLRLSFCRTPKPLGDNRLASDACARTAEQLVRSMPAVVPSDACTRFGPNVPAGVRPTDPDVTGGYYQPIRIALDDLDAVAMLRLRCPLTDAPLAITRAYRERYAPNQTPALRKLSITHDGVAIAPDVVPASTEIALHSGWSAESEEHYVVYERSTRALQERTEALRISWYVTAGELSADSTSERRALNHFQTPDGPGTVQLWLVLRDDRGAQSYASYELTVR
jgi:hypothetical protein